MCSLLLRLRLLVSDLKSYPGVAAVADTTAVVEAAVGGMTMTIRETDTITREKDVYVSIHDLLKQIRVGFS